MVWKIDFSNKKHIFIILSILFILGIIGYFIFENKLHKDVIVEAGSPLDISQFIKNEKHKGIFVTDLTSVNRNEPGEHNINIKIGRRFYQSTLHIKDTIAPTGEPVHREIWAREELEAKDFVKNIVDVTKVSIYFKEKPDFHKAGEQDVHLILEDTSGNQREIRSILFVKEDREPPEIHGLMDQLVYIGDPVSYKRGVTVTDNRDQNIELTIDSSDVNLKKEGLYEVSYTATDSSGNTTIKSIHIRVKAKPKDYMEPEELHQLADQVLKKIITDKMTDIEKAWAIFKWTNQHITYTGTSDKSDWMQGAVRGIKRGNGDCFNYYATARELLTRAGFENLGVERDGNGIHFWNLVKIDEEWYHFDTTPYRRGYPYVCFLRTDDEVAEYSKIRKNYYKFDKSQYPKVSQKPIKFNRKF